MSHVHVEFCSSCKKVVQTAYPHSCYDAAKVIGVQDAERRVVEAAEEYVRTNDILCGESDAKCDAQWVAHMEQISDANIAALDALFEAVRALRTARGDA